MSEQSEWELEVGHLFYKGPATRTNSATVVIPWNSKLSKNARMFYRNYGTTRPFVIKEVRELQESLRAEFARQPGPWYEAKTWINLFVQMPSRKSDAINVLDTIADAIKTGIGVDDKWFCIESLDWQLNRVDPKVYITIWQDAESDMRYCTECSDLKPLTEEYFSPSKTHYKGLRPYCRDCIEARKKTKVITTHCPKGHELTEDNLYRGPNGTLRRCKTCAAESQMRYRDKQSQTKDVN